VCVQASPFAQGGRVCRAPQGSGTGKVDENGQPPCGPATVRGREDRRLALMLLLSQGRVVQIANDWVVDRSSQLHFGSRRRLNVQSGRGELRRESLPLGAVAKSRRP